MNLLAVVLSVAGAWFDANVSGSAKWPAGTDPVEMPGTGTWDGRAFVTETGKAVSCVEAFGSGLSFAPAVTRDAADGEILLATEMTFASRRRLVVPDGAKAAITVLGEGEDAVYCGLVTNAWVKLEGATPVLNASVGVTVTLKGTDDGLFVRYAVNGTPLTAGGTEWLKSSAADTAVTRLSYQGTGKVAALGGEARGVASCALTIPETLGGLTVTAVRVGGVEITETSAGVYDIPTNAVVTVAFAAEKGFVPSSQTMRFAMTRPMELPEAGRPTPICPTAITISEFMAAPTNGCDWIELRNATNVDVDVGGWLLTDDYAKKTSKWKAVEGDAVVPANGYLVVMADGDATSWPAGVAHVKLGLSDEGEALGLATPDGEAVTSRIDYDLQFDEVSCGFAPDAATLSYFREATPGAANVTKPYAPPTPKVTLSEAHGWKDAPFELTMATADGRPAEIRYTLDGSAPTEASALYEGPLRIGGTSVVRAGVPVADAILQRDVSGTYLFVEDVVAQGATPPVGFPADREVNNQAMRYGMDTRVTEGADRERVRVGFTNAIPTVSFVVDPKSLFDKDEGIYVNALKEWERLALVEQIDPVKGNANEWSVPAGLRIRGGSSRGADHPKHSFQLVFRREYGVNKLKFPLFGENGASGFKKLDLRTSQNFAWAYGNSGDNFINEVVARDLQGAVGGDPHARTYACHLFVNGVYWGLYQTDERIDDHYAESYNGGDKEDYDVVRTFHDERLTFETGVVEGNDAAWRSLWKLMDGGFAGANYPKACGLDADYVRNGDLPVLLNPTNLMHYMMNVHWTANTDTPSYGPMPNNVAAFRNRIDGRGDRDGFLFVLHDTEHALGYGNGKYDSDTTKYGTTEFSGNNNGSYANFAPAQLHYRLCQNEEYRMAFADQVYRHVVKKGGAFTVPEALKRFRVRMAEVDDAIACEAARWGAACKTMPDHELWLTNCQTSVTFIERRAPYFLKSYRDRRWYPSVDAPTLSRNGRELADGDRVRRGAKLSLAVPEGSVAYYTLDGTDPRQRGGGLDPAATAYDASKGLVIDVDGPVQVNARARDSKGEWSALESVRLTVKSGLVIVVM